MPAPNLEMTEPEWDCVDNPGGWHGYSFRPNFGKRGRNKKCIFHNLPSRCIYVPVGTYNKRIRDGWEFFYKEREANDENEDVKSVLCYS